MPDLEKMIDMIEKYSEKSCTEDTKQVTEKDYKALLEECAEEIENIYGRETELTIRIRELL